MSGKDDPTNVYKTSESLPPNKSNKNIYFYVAIMVIIMVVVIVLGLALT
jgi:hypothetical protein